MLVSVYWVYTFSIVHLYLNIPRATDDDASKLFLSSRLSFANFLSTLCSAAMIRCRSTINEQFVQEHSFHLHRPLWPLSGLTTPWFLQRAHFGDTIVFSLCCLLLFSVLRTGGVLNPRVSLQEVVDLLCENLYISDLYISEECTSLHGILNDCSDSGTALILSNIIDDRIQWREFLTNRCESKLYTVIGYNPLRMKGLFITLLHSRPYWTLISMQPSQNRCPYQQNQLSYIGILQWQICYQLPYVSKCYCSLTRCFLSLIAVCY